MKKRTFVILATFGAILALGFGVADFFGIRHQETLVQAQELNKAASDGIAKSNGCRLRDFRGTYGIFANGTVITPPPNVPAGPFATVGRMVVDDDGTAEVSLTRSFNGTITREVLPGFLTVNDDCTGTLTFGGVRIFDFGAVDKRDELQFIQTNPGTVVTVIAKRQ